jgi:glycosyltransferase involved in cell wall biosynthesis
MSPKTRVLFLHNSLAAGGAERQLCELVKHLDPDQFEIHVAVFYDPGNGNGGELWPEMLSILGPKLHSLHKRRGAAGYLVAIPKLLGLVFRTRPHILHGYLEGNLPLLLAGRLFGKPVVWGIRRASDDFSKLDPLSIRLLRILVRLSPFTDMVIFNSEAGLRSHRAMGMRSPRMEVVPNGFDTAKFAPDGARGAAQRQAWGVPDHAPLIGIMGRLSPVKDHPTFLRAAARLAKEWPEARFICVGGGSEAYTQALKQQAEALGIAERVLWPGTSTRMGDAYNALSILVLSSTDEGFPNVIGEAMACGIPCVATRVGDAALLMGDTGLAVQSGDDEGIASAVSSLLRETGDQRAARSRACRERICSTFSVEALAKNTGQLLNAVRSSRS